MSTKTPNSGFRRILLKLSGEALAGSAEDKKFGIDAKTLDGVCKEIAGVIESGTQVAVVIGGGNFFRGISASESGIERATADYIGMLATVMNALAVQQGLKQVGIEARVQSAIPISPVSEPYVRLRALKHLNLGRVVIFAAGTGNPYFTTDTAASLRAAEINADILVKATKVDGVYDSDPATNPDATRYEQVTYDEVLQKRLGVMDATAIALCRDNNMPMRVLSISEEGALRRMATGGSVGTLITSA
ncbi:uridylate kinase [Arenicella chitinivorans]|uniref:Uridylate kinase n=1 Tax=Arenicella chitinivorans TaxID=1329800 RepID=A0A918RKU8_9GAMM|nr:UMP kinase [Arenicella chitinivorans]GHA00904.1 uridylate kinase [Arenicella chitinivorans]